MKAYRVQLYIVMPHTSKNSYLLKTTCCEVTMKNSLRYQDFWKFSFFIFLTFYLFLRRDHTLYRTYLKIGCSFINNIIIIIKHHPILVSHFLFFSPSLERNSRLSTTIKITKIIPCLTMMIHCTKILLVS